MIVQPTRPVSSATVKFCGGMPERLAIAIASSRVRAVWSWSSSRFTASGWCAVQASARGRPMRSSSITGPQIVSWTSRTSSAPPLTRMCSFTVAKRRQPSGVR